MNNQLDATQNSSQNVLQHSFEGNDRSEKSSASCQGYIAALDELNPCKDLLMSSSSDLSISVTTEKQQTRSSNTSSDTESLVPTLGSEIGTNFVSSSGSMNTCDNASTLSPLLTGNEFVSAFNAINNNTVINSHNECVNVTFTIACPSNSSSDDSELFIINQRSFSNDNSSENDLTVVSSSEEGQGSLHSLEIVADASSDTEPTLQAEGDEDEDEEDAEGSANRVDAGLCSTAPNSDGDRVDGSAGANTVGDCPADCVNGDDV